MNGNGGGFVDPQTGGFVPYPQGTATVGTGPLPAGAPAGQLLTPSPVSGGTLGDVSQQAQGGGFNDYLQMYQQALNTIKQTQPRAHMDPPSILRNILSFGGAGADYNASQMFNAYQDNKAADLARQMVASKANSDALAGKDLMQQLGLKLRILEYERGVANDKLTEVDREHNRGVKDTFDISTLTPDRLATLHAQGYDVEPAPEVGPNRGRIVPRGGGTGGGKLAPLAGGGWGMPAGSPAGKALQAVGGGGAPPGGQEPEDIVAQKKLNIKKRELAATEKAKTAPYSQRALADLDKLQAAVEQAFPAGESAGVSYLKGVPRTLAARGGGMGIPFSPQMATIDTLRSGIESYIRGMGGASRMPQELMKVILADLPRLSANRERNLFLIDRMRQRIKDAAEQYPEGEGQNPGTEGAGISITGTPSSSTTTTSGQLGTGRRLSSGRLIFEGP